jgi:hypothetical protein
MWLKALMTLEHARPRQSPQEPITIEIDFRNPRLDVGECDRVILVDQISQKEACPSVAGPGIGNKENIIGKNRQAPTRDLPSGEHTPRLRERSK